MIENKKPRVALCLPGGGSTGAMYQIGALAALQDGIGGLDTNDFDLYVGTSTGAPVAAMLAGGRPINRIYRAILDPADDYFPLDRRDVLRSDRKEWRRMVTTALYAFAHGTRSLLSKAPTPATLWLELDRFIDSAPAGLFSLHRYEEFLGDFFQRRTVPNRFEAMPRALRIMAHDLDSGEQVLFGSPGQDDVTVTRACVASMALAPFFSPVQVKGRHYIDPGPAQCTHVDVAVAEGAQLVIVVNPLVPMRVESVPTGHGQRSSVRDKGFFWVASQANRIGAHALLSESIRRHRGEGKVEILVLEPGPADTSLFLHPPMQFAARREILEHAYRSPKGRIAGWGAENGPAIELAGWSLAAASADSTAEATAGAE